MDITLRTIQKSDHKLLLKWPSLDFVSEWYEKRKFVYDDIEKVLLSPNEQKIPVEGYMVLHREHPIGYMHVFKPSDYPEYAECLQMPEDTACMDLMIGDKNFIHKGLGKDIVTLFVEAHVFTKDDINTVISGPAPTDTSMIRMYGKAGFEYYKTVHCKDQNDPEHIMILRKSKDTVLFKA